MSFPFDLHSVAVSDSHLPCPRRFLSRPRHSTSVKRRPVGYLSAFGFFRLPRGVPRRLLIRSIPISDAGGQCETKQRLSLTRKRVVATQYKKDDPLNCSTSSSDISGYHADFHEGHGTIGAWHGHGRLCVNRPLVLHVSFTSFEPCIVIHICNKNQQNAHYFH